MRYQPWTGVAAVGLMVALTGCGNQIKQSLGLTKQSPDEFAVVAHAPLTLPPDFNLRPPQPGAPRPQEGTTADQARTALFGNGQDTGIGAPAADQTSGEVALLQNAGATGIDPNIRSQIDQETTEQIERDQSIVDRLVFWREQEPYGVEVDPVAESKRLQENAALGKAATEGETPTIKRKKKGLLEGLF